MFVHNALKIGQLSPKSRLLRLSVTTLRTMTTGADASRLQTSLVIDPQQLSELATEGTVPIDVSWFMPNVARDPSAEFLQNRIPRARRLDLDVVASGHPLGLKHMMPSPMDFAEACR